MNVARLISGSSQVPIGTPSRPATSIGAIRRQAAAPPDHRQRRQVAQHGAGRGQLGGNQRLDRLQPQGQAGQRRAEARQAVDEAARHRASQNQGQDRPVAAAVRSWPYDVPGLFLEVAPLNTICWR